MHICFQRRTWKACFASVLLCLLMITGCSDIPDLPAEEHLKIAKTDLARYAFKTAIIHAEAATAKSEEGSEIWAEAEFILAMAYHHEQPSGPTKIEQAREHYQKIIDKLPDTELAARSRIGVARIEEMRDYKDDPVKLEPAREQYKIILEKWSNHPIGDEAVMRLAGNHIQTHDQAQMLKGIEILETYLEQYPENSLASPMWEYIGSTYSGTVVNQKAEGIKAYVKADELGLLDKNGVGRIYWTIAGNAVEVGQRDLAIEYYSKIITEAPTSGLAYDAQIRLIGMGVTPPEIPLKQYIQSDSETPETEKLKNEALEEGTS